MLIPVISWDLGVGVLNMNFGIQLEANSIFDIQKCYQFNSNSINWGHNFVNSIPIQLIGPNNVVN